MSRTKTAKKNPAARRKEALSYAETHWGELGAFASRKVRAPDPRKGPIVLLGYLAEIVYLTKKGGDDGPTLYEHHFGKKGRGLPMLAYGPEGLFILGGKARVTERGIVG